MMKIKLAILAMTGLALVSGCNRGAGNTSANASSNATNNSATANAAAPAAQSATGAGSGAPVDRTFLIGHWGQSSDCSSTMSFNADGSAEATGEREEARWSFENGAVMAGPVGKPTVRTPVSRSGDNLVLTGPQGQTLTLTRCASAATGEPAADAEVSNEAEETSE